LAILGSTHAALGKFEDARRYVAEAMNSIETSKEKWFEAEVNRVAGEIAVRSPPPHTARAEGYFERALAVARKQQAKSWELRAAMSLARLCATRARLWKRASYWLRCTGGSVRGSTRAI
jgi:predicted ATPase